MWAIAAVLISALGIGIALAVAVFGLSAAGRDAVSRLGSPTPDSAKVDLATSKANKQTEAAVDAIHQADTPALIDRARELSERGKSGK